MRYLISLLLLLAGCYGGETIDDSNRVRYHHDVEHGVGCWTVWGEGIDCLPDSEYQEGTR